MAMNPYIKLFKLTENARQFQSLTEIWVGAVLVLLLFAATLRWEQPLLEKVELITFANAVYTSKMNNVVEYSISGQWPDHAEVFDKKETRHYRLEGLSASYGSYALMITALESDAKLALAYRIVETGEQQPILYWLCGYADEREGEHVRIPNISSLPAPLLGRNCKRKRH